MTVLASWSLEHAGPRVTVLRGEEPVGEVASLAVDPGSRRTCTC